MGRGGQHAGPGRLRAVVVAAALAAGLAGAGCGSTQTPKLTPYEALLNTPVDWCLHETKSNSQRAFRRCLAQTAPTDVPGHFANHDIATQISGNRTERDYEQCKAAGDCP